MAFEENQFHQFDDLELAVTIARPSVSPRASLLLLHGGPGGQRHGPENLYGDLAEVLARHGFESVRFDFCGAGESSGDYRDMTIARSVAQFHSVYDSYIQSAHGPRIVVGESYGATIALRGWRADIDGLILLWPALWFLDNTFAPFVTDEKLRLAQKQGYIVEDGVEVGLPFLEEVLEIRDVQRELSQVDVATLLIHGTSDSEVPYTQSVQAVELIPADTELTLVDGGDHCLERPEERRIVRERIMDWLERNFPVDAK